MEEEKIIIDYDMIIAAKSGSMQALGYILDRHSDYINRVVYHIVLKPPTFALLLTVLPVHK